MVATRAAADTLKRVHLELGGKAPVIVFDDVDLDSALETIAGTGYYNAGQDCTAATRVLAGTKVYDDVVAGLTEQARGLVIGDTLDPADFPDNIRAAASGAAGSIAGLRSLEEVEREVIAATLEATHYKISRAAEALGISRKTLLEKRKKYGLK